MDVAVKILLSILPDLTGPPVVCLSNYVISFNIPVNPDSKISKTKYGIWSHHFIDEKQALNIKNRILITNIHLFDSFLFVMIF